MVKTLKHLFTPQVTNNHRPRVLHVEGIFLFCLILIASFSFVRLGALRNPTILGFASSITPSQVIEQTNLTRASLGLAPLSLNSRLSSAAAAKGSNMCAQQYWAHISPSGVTPWSFIKNSGYNYSVAGENLARDFADTGAMIGAWMASPTHRANIVSEKYKEIGVAVLDCNLLGSDTALVVQLFGSQLAKLPATEKVAASVQAPAKENEGTVAGAESAPKLLAKTNPELVLQTPPPQANPTNSRVLSPLQAMKAVIVAVVGVLLLVLLFDLWIEHKQHTLRLVGKNLAHILYLSGILLVVLIIKSGRIY